MAMGLKTEQGKQRILPTMSEKSLSQINEYANSMFRFEYINEAWIHSCADYLKLLFNDSLKGKSIVDYAFGRGNWSLAFLKAGAKEVIAIDESFDNVKRFDLYCNQNGISDIQIIHGNILNRKLELKADIVWLYGIFHHIFPKDVDTFLTEIKKMRKNEESLIYIYAYNSNSLRNLIVDLCRGLYIYKSEDEFINDNYLFLRCAKGRASDDLLVPCIKWYGEMELQDLLEVFGIIVLRQDIDYFEFLNNTVNQEFYPVQFLCGFTKKEKFKVKIRLQPYEKEREIISSLANDIFSAFKDNEERKKICIGLFNTYFSFLKNPSDIYETLIEIFLYLMRLLLQSKEFKKIKFTYLTECYYELLIQSMKDINRDNNKEFPGKNLFTDFLVKNRVRL